MGIGGWELWMGELGLDQIRKFFFLNLKIFSIFRFFSPFFDFSKWKEEMYEELKTNISYVVGLMPGLKPHLISGGFDLEPLQLDTTFWENGKCPIFRFLLFPIFFMDFKGIINPTI